MTRIRSSSLPRQRDYGFDAGRKISRYFYGIQYASRDMRLGLVEASEGKIGTPVDQVLLFCYHYDPSTGKYGFLISRVIKAAGVLTVSSPSGILVLLILYPE